LDGSAADPLADFSQINSELALFDEHQANRPQVVAFNKMDLPEAQARWPETRSELERRGHEVFAMSALARTGVREVLYRAVQRMAEAQPIPAGGDMPVYLGGRGPARLK